MLKQTAYIILILLVLPIVSASLAGFGNQPPVVESIDTQYLIVGEPYSLAVKAVDSDKDALTFSDNSELFDINSKTGEIKFIPKEEQIGRHVATISASDGQEIADITVYFVVDIAQRESKFELDKSAIKVLASYEEPKSESILITNLGGSEAVYSLDLQGIDNEAFLSAEQAQIPAERSKSIDITFGKVKPGIYTGKLKVRSGEQVETLPVVFEVESKEIGFDAKLSLQAEEFKPEAEVIFSVTAIDLLNSGPSEVRVYYYIYDLLGNEIYSKYEDIIVENQAAFTKSIILPTYLKGGEYVAAVKIVADQSVGTTSQIFKIAGEEKAEASTSAGISWMMYIILGIIAVIAVFLIFTNRHELLKVKRLKIKEIKLTKIDGLIRKKKKYLSQLRALDAAFELKSVSKKNYEEIKRKINTEIRKLNEIIKHRESRI